VAAEEDIDEVVGNGLNLGDAQLTLIALPLCMEIPIYYWVRPKEHEAVELLSKHGSHSGTHTPSSPPHHHIAFHIVTPSLAFVLHTHTFPPHHFQRKHKK
jgi:hypothetical protein